MPEVDHPGIPATIVVENGLAEVLLDGESLGRWSLYDVHAARLVSSAFSLSLDGEEITFIADEPVDFAYKGVEHMAGVWARYKAMTIPRRVVAVGRSRRGTMPSRIPELREAMLQNLQTAGRSPSYFSPAPDSPAPEPEPAPWAKRLEAYSSVPAPVDETEAIPIQKPAPPQLADTSEAEVPKAVEPPEAAEPSEALESPEARVVPQEVEVTDPVEPPGRSAPSTPSLRPGPGLIPRQVTRAPFEAVSGSAEPPDWDAAWEEPPVYEEPSYEELPPDAALAFFDEEQGKDEGPAEDDITPVTIHEEAATEQESWPTVIADEDSGPKEVVVDLGHLEVDKEVSPSSPVDDRVGQGETLEPDLELLFAGAPLPEGERSGLFGAVRSAFARNRGGTHEHQFVEAPGGIGIVRQICADCGYISIGVSD